ncbi:MAG: hypothetical protein AB9835_08830 [Eubacteriales bacterium]
MRRNSLYIILSILLLLSLSLLVYAEVGAQGGQPQNGNGAVTPAQPFESGGAATAGDGGSADGSVVTPDGGAGAGDTGGGAGATAPYNPRAGQNDAAGDLAAQNANDNPLNGETTLAPDAQSPMGDQGATGGDAAQENGTASQTVPQNAQNNGTTMSGGENAEDAGTQDNAPTDGSVAPTKNLTDTDDENNTAGIIAAVLAGIILISLVIYAMTRKKRKGLDDKDYPNTD